MFIGRSSWSAVYFINYEGSVMKLAEKGNTPSSLSITASGREVTMKNNDSTALHYLICLF